jgi:hypothetical protein
MKRACPSGGDTQRRGRQQTPPIETHNKAAICREKYAALVAAHVANISCRLTAFGPQTFY